MATKRVCDRCGSEINPVAEYIDRGTAIAKLTVVEATKPSATMAYARRLLADMPTADVVPVVHGKWFCMVDDDSWAECSECGECYNACDNGGTPAFMLFCDLHKYCPNRGARMDGDDDAKES